jgi:hypothetical protein
MVKRAFVCLAASLALVCTIASSAHAHRSDAAMSLVEVSPSTGRLEVSHTLYAHDLEGALLAGAVTLQWLASPRGEAALRDYCLRQFVLTNESGQEIALSFVGAELRGGIINVYFEAGSYPSDSVIVDSNLLQDINENQVNQVNFRARGRIVSAVFAKGSQPQRLNLR